MNYANYLGWSDIHPFEIVRRVSNKTIDIRGMDAELDPDWKPEIIPGGFAGHCVNQREQRWNIVSNPANRVIRIRLHKSGDWKDTRGLKFSLSDQPVKFYDYDF